MSGAASGGHGHDDEPHEEHEEHVNHEAWVIPYADLLTLLMAMFIALFAMSSVDKDKFKELSIGFNDALGGGELTTGVFAAKQGHEIIPAPNSEGGSGSSSQQGGDPGPTQNDIGETYLDQILQREQALQAAIASEKATLEGIKRALEAAATREGFADKLHFELLDDGLHLTIITDQVLFNSGEAEIQPYGTTILDLIAIALEGVDNPILIGGHTDTNPIRTAQFPSNWELSGARSSAVLRYLMTVGLAESDLHSSGHADTRPIASNATEAGRSKNRRVEILIQSQVVDALLDATGLDGKPTTGGLTTGDLATGVDGNFVDIVGSLSAEAGP